MKNIIYRITVTAVFLILTVKVFTQVQTAAIFNANSQYQYISANSNGEMYAIKFSPDAPKVKETMYVDLTNDQSRITVYNDNNVPTETIQNNNLYVYAKEGNGLSISPFQENYKELNSDAKIIQQEGFNLSFTDKLIVKNAQWIESVANSKKVIDKIVSCSAAFETLAACAAVGLNPVMAIPCTGGLINLIGQNYNNQSPEISFISDKVSGNIDKVIKDIVNNSSISQQSKDLFNDAGKRKLDIPATLSYVIDKVSDKYDDVREKYHKLASQIIKNKEEAFQLSLKQQLTGKGNMNKERISKLGGIIERTVIATDKIEKQIDQLGKSITQTNYMSISEKINKLQKEIKLLRINAQKEYNDSLHHQTFTVDWKKTDAEAYYAIKMVKYDSIQWYDYKRLPSVMMTALFSSQKKPLMVQAFDEVKTYYQYINTLGIRTKNAKNENIDGMLMVNKEFRNNEALNFAVSWDEYKATNTLIFNQSKFDADPSESEKGDE